MQMDYGSYAHRCHRIEAAAGCTRSALMMPRLRTRYIAMEGVYRREDSLLAC